MNLWLNGGNLNRFQDNWSFLIPGGGVVGGGGDDSRVQIIYFPCLASNSQYMILKTQCYYLLAVFQVLTICKRVAIAILKRKESMLRSILIWLSKMWLAKSRRKQFIKPGCTTRYTGLSCPRFLYIFWLSLSNAIGEFRIKTRKEN